MSDEFESATADSDKYYLEDRERWESLGFDWEGWNATIAKILQQQTVASTGGQQGNPGKASLARGKRSARSKTMSMDSPSPVRRSRAQKRQAVAKTDRVREISES